MLAPICDACRHAPPLRRALCEKPPLPTDGSCDEKQCDWILDSEKTLGVVWGGSHGAARGWGNSVGYIRNIHEVAAMLGRRLLAKPVHAYLPTAHLRLGGRHSWAVPEDGMPAGTVVINDSMAEPFAAPGGFKGLEHAPNRTAVKWALVSYLARFDEHRALWLNFSHPAMYLLLKGATCGAARHMGDFGNCMGRLMTTPVGELSERQSALRERLSRLGARLLRGDAAGGGGVGVGVGVGVGGDDGDGVSIGGGGGGGTAEAMRTRTWGFGGGRYIGVHIRTFGADMNIPRGTRPDSALALEFLAWEVQVNASDYASAIRRLCRNGSLPLYVASDSRAAIGVFETACRGRVLHQYMMRTPPPSATALAGTGPGAGRTWEQAEPDRAVHSEALRRNASGAGSTDLLLDWLMLAGAHAVVRWGAQHSSFASSARLRSCSGRLWRSPKSWRYKSASSWLLFKLRFHAHKVRLNASYDCQATISPMLRTIPTCESGCVMECLGNVHRAFA